MPELLRCPANCPSSPLYISSSSVWPPALGEVNVWVTAASRVSASAWTKKQWPRASLASCFSLSPFPLHCHLVRTQDHHVAISGFPSVLQRSVQKFSFTLREAEMMTSCPQHARSLCWITCVTLPWAFWFLRWLLFHDNLVRSWNQALGRTTVQMLPGRFVLFVCLLFVLFCWCDEHDEHEFVDFE